MLSPLTDLILLVSFIINPMVQLYHWHQSLLLFIITLFSPDGSAVLLTRYHQFLLLLLIKWFSTLNDQIASVSFIIHHHRVQPSHLARHHQSPLLSITWFSPLIEQIPSVSFIIQHHMVQPSNWLDTISLLQRPKWTLWKIPPPCRKLPSPHSFIFLLTTHASECSKKSLPAALTSLIHFSSNYTCQWTL